MSTSATMDACFHYWKKHFLAVLLSQNFCYYLKIYSWYLKVLTF